MTNSFYFKIKTGNKTGKATIHITASGGSQQAKETIEIEVRNPNPAVTFRNSQWVEKGESVTLPYALNGASPASSRILLEVSRIPSVDISRRFDYLYNYQHHCTEQLTSKALPLLFVSQFKAVDEEEAQKIKVNVQEAIRQLYARQLPNGGFVYWPGNANADEWITSYAGMFLVLAQEKGYAVNSNVLNKWKRFQRAAAQNWRMPDQDDSWGHAGKRKCNRHIGCAVPWHPAQVHRLMPVCTTYMPVALAVCDPNCHPDPASASSAAARWKRFHLFSTFELTA